MIESGATMPVTRAAKGRISIDSLLEQRYGQEIGRAALRPGPGLPPPGNGPGDVDDRLREPTLHLPPAPAWVRAWSRLGYGIFPGAREAFNALGSIPNPLVNEAVTVTALAGITGSASGGMSIALAAMADPFIANANAAGIPMEVLHRVASMASGGMDTLPHNGAVITLLAVTGLTHRQAYKDIFAITVIKTLAVFAIIGLFYATGWV